MNIVIKVKFEPVFDSIPPGAITFDVTKGKAYRRNKDGSFQELDPINLKPLEPVDGTGVIMTLVIDPKTGKLVDKNKLNKKQSKRKKI